uniref:MAP3K7 C-terminal like n=1 Tax=Rattus norvegicus TaxID=10116 RepID=A0ABK0LTI0_RAT
MELRSNPRSLEVQISSLCLVTSLKSTRKPLPGFTTLHSSRLPRKGLYATGRPQDMQVHDPRNDTPSEEATPLVFPELEQQLQPLPPCHDSAESMQVFKQHCQIAEEYHEVKKEIALLEERKKELIAKLDQAEKEKLDAAQLVREFEALTEENRTLKMAQSQCVEQLEKLRIQYQKRQGSS